MRHYIIFLLALSLSACHTRELAVVKVGGKFGCINRKGRFVIKPSWDYILQGDKNKTILVERDSLFGYIDRKGRILIEPQYKDADLFSEGLAFVGDGMRYGYINTAGDTIIHFQFQDNAWGNFSKGYADIVLNDRSGYIDKSGKVVIPIIFKICYPFNSNIAVVLDTLNEFKLVTKKGNILEYNNKNIGNKKLIPPKDSYPGSFEANTGRGRMNKKGDTIVPPIYAVTGNLINGMFIVQNKSGKWGAYNQKGELIVKPLFDQMWHYQEKLSNFEMNGKWGYISKNGAIVIEPQFDYASGFTNGLAYVEINGKSGFINKKGKVIIKPIFEINRGSQFK